MPQKKKPTRWVDAAGKVWKQQPVMLGYCLHHRAGVLAIVALPWSARNAECFTHLAPSDILEVREWSESPGVLPRDLVAGQFVKVFYISNECCGTFRIETLPSSSKICITDSPACPSHPAR